MLTVPKDQFIREVFHMVIQAAAFTERGWKLARDIFETWSPEPVFFRKKEPLAKWCEDGFAKGAALVFIGAVGIAVRAVAPLVRDKLTDIPVIVIDESGQFVIPILSGHVGGANELALRISSVCGAVPVITTATDLEGLFAVDVFARKNYLRIENPDLIRRVSGRVLAGEHIIIGVEGIRHSEALQAKASQKWGPKIEICPFSVTLDMDVQIIRQKQEEAEEILTLIPREFVLGIGCRSGKSYHILHDFVSECCEELGIRYPDDVAMLASIDRKRGEPGLNELSGRGRIPFVTFSASELAQVGGEFSRSEFVERMTGVDNVCERSALAAAGDGSVLVMRKRAKEGMTLAIARRVWADLSF